MVILKLFVILFVAFSFFSLPGAMLKPIQLPTVHLARANPQTCQTRGASGACSEFWYPAGPEMNTELVTAFTDSTNELTNIQNGQFASIDLTDSPLPSGLIQTFTTQGNFRVSAPVPGGFGEVEFNLANNFWGCPFGFGNQPCGVYIRDGIAHLIDKTLFVSNEAALAGQASAVDNPESTYNGGLPSANPCAWDSNALESGTNCVVGAPGGTAYHFQTASGADGYPWLQANPSPDFCAAANDIAIGINMWMPSTPPPPAGHGLFLQKPPGGGFPTAPESSWTFNPSTDCRLRYTDAVAAGWLATNYVNFYVRTDNPALQELGTSLAAQICYMFTGYYTGSYAVPCAYPNTNPILTETPGRIGGFQSFVSSCNGNSPNQCWGLYTSGMALQGHELLAEEKHNPDLRDPFDTSLYFTFNSRFVSGVPSIQCSSGSRSSCSPGLCSPQSVSTAVSSDYMYLCSPDYDSMSSAMENAPCLYAQGDPTLGQPNNGPGGYCPGTSQLSSMSAGVQAEDLFGRGAYTIPIYSPSNQYGYLSNWSRVINNVGGGIPSFFTWLNAYSSSPAQSGTIRQGMSQPPRSVNPYIASTFWDLMIVGNIYDTLFAANPLSDTQPFDWMTTSAFAIENSSLGYTAPAHTLTTYRFNISPTLAFQDSRPVTSYDVAFSYLSMVGSGAFLGTGATPMTGFTILSPSQFDIGVNSLGPFILSGLTGIPIVSGRYWTAAGPPTWDTDLGKCTSGSRCTTVQYTLAGAAVTCSTNSPDIACASFPMSDMRIDTAKITATYDPISDHTFVGSGPWQCGTLTPASGNGMCTLTGIGNGASSYTLSVFPRYFRSSSELAAYIWSGDCTQSTVCSPITAPAQAGACYNQPITATQCAHYQQGIGNGYVLAPESASAYSIVSAFYNFNWLEPFNWALNPPLGLGPLPPLLYNPFATGTATDPKVLTPAPDSSSCSASNTYYNC